MARVSIPFSRYGLTGERDPSRLHTGDLFVANNLDFTVGNLIQKDGGSVRINSAPLSGSPIVMTGHDWWPTPSTQRRVVGTSDGVLYKDDMSGAFSTVLKSGLTPNRLIHMVDGGAEVAGNNRKLFIFNGANPTQVLANDASATTDLATPPVEWAGGNHPIFGFIFRNSLLAGGTAGDPHRVYGSDPQNHENFTNASSFTINCYPGEGQRLVAGISSTSRAFLWKHPVGIYWINDAASTVAGWFIQPATRQFGAAATPHSVVQVDQGTVAFLTNTGNIMLMQETSGSLSGVEFVDLVKALNLRSYIKDNFNLARLDKSHLAWYEDKKQLHITYASIGSSVENRRLVIDFNEENTRVSIVNKDINTCLWTEQDSDLIPRLMFGDNAGFVWRADQPSRSINGTSYTMDLTTAPTDFSDINEEYMVKKLFYRLHLEYEPTGNYDLGVQTFIDGKNYGTVYFNQGGAGAIFPFTLPATLGGNELRRRSRDIAGEGYYLSLRITDGTINNPKIARAWIEFEPTTAAR